MMTASLDNRIVGLVDALGSGGVMSGQSDQWRLVFHLAAWKTRDGGISTGKLRCEYPVSKKGVKVLMTSVSAYSIVEITVTEKIDSSTVQVGSVALSSGSDSQLEQIRDELQKPIRIKDDLFGELEFDRRSGSYDGNASWCGARVRVCLSCDDPAHPSAVILAAKRLFHAEEEWNSRVRDFAIERLLPVKNKAWLDDGERELSADEFASRMKLETISIDQDGAFSFWHNDGDLFLGHVIHVMGDLTNGLIGADIPG